MKPNYPQRIICLTEETTETLYAIGASDLIIGITQYTLRPPQAKKEKPIVGGAHFGSAYHTDPYYQTVTSHATFSSDLLVK